MTIRSRTAATITTIGLGAAGVMHIAWAAGSSWPAADRDALADLVVGVRPFPSSALTMGVVGALGAAVVLVEAESRSGPVQQSSRRSRICRRAAFGVPVVLALRGAAGLVTSGLRLGPATPQFRRCDLRVYSPVCLALATSSGMAVWRPASPVMTPE